VLGLARETIERTPTAKRSTEHSRPPIDTIAARGGDGGNATVWLVDPSRPDGRVLEENGFKWQRDLYQMRVALPLAETPKFPVATRSAPIGTGTREAAWLEVNNRAFGNHHDQGGWVAETPLPAHGRAWFEPEQFLLAFDDVRPTLGLAGFHG